MSIRHWFLALTCAAPLVGISPASATASRSPSGEASSYSTLHATSVETARGQALDWLKAAGKNDPATLKAFDAIWAQTDRPLVDRVADSFALGNPEAARLLTETRDPSVAAPLSVPAILKDEKQSAFFRANLGLAYARELSNLRVYEEGLEALRLIKPEDVVDPAAYFFHRAVAEHALLLKADAGRSIVGVLQDVSDVPQRYRMVAELMAGDMQTWKDKDLGEIARKMDNIERRLALARGGPHTQKIQKEVVARLDEIIKRIENQSKGSASNGGACPNGGPPENGGGASTGSPMQDSQIATLEGKGVVDQKRLGDLAKNWGQLPEKERTKAMLELTRDMPARHREVIENYIKKISQAAPSSP